MLARVATWEGGSPEGIRAATAEMRANMAQGPPPGVTSTGFTMLADAEGGRILMIGMFENEDDLRTSEAALGAMNPPDGMGRRTAVDIYEVGAEMRV